MKNRQKYGGHETTKGIRLGLLVFAMGALGAVSIAQFVRPSRTTKVTAPKASIEPVQHLLP